MSGNIFGPSVRKITVGFLAACGLAVAAVPAAAAVPTAPPTAPTHSTQHELARLVGLAAERVLLADMVAAAKFGTNTPIEDPERERQVLADAAARAQAAGIDTQRTVAFFRAQIKESKFVQRSLYGLWTRHPELAPTRRPDLATEVRPKLDRITVEFIEQLAATDGLRHSTVRCEFSLTRAEIQTVASYDLNRLHKRALWGATSTVCN